MSFCCISCAISSIAQSAAVPSKSLAYAVVSIRPHKETDNGSRWWTPTADGYAAKNVEPAQLIREAYDVQCSDQLIGLPAWAFEETFDIDAKVDEEALPAYQKLSERERREQAAFMLRSMLESRFGLKVHHQIRTLSIYALVIAKNGSKLKQSQSPEGSYGMLEGRGRIAVKGERLGSRFVVGLSDKTGRVVVDRTGLTGFYNIDLRWTPEEDIAAGASGPSLFTAIEEQLGLKLVSERAPVDVIVVDHLERPSAN